MSAPFTRTETAPVLRTFGDHASRMANLVRLRPSPLTRIAFAPASAVHAIGAWLHLSVEAERPDYDVAALLDETDPRNLLRTAIPEAPARLYRALGRAGDRVRDRRFYERLAAVCTSPAADVLWGEHTIDPGLLSFAERLPTLDPAVLRLRHLLSRSIDNAERLHATLLFLRAQRVLAEGDLELPPQAGLPALAKSLQAALDRIPQSLIESALAEYGGVQAAGASDAGRARFVPLHGARRFSAATPQKRPAPEHAPRAHSAAPATRPRQAAPDNTP